MGVSFGMLGVLLMLDVCFIVNYFVIRAMRRWTNRKSQMESSVSAVTALEKEQEELKHSSDIISNNFQALAEMFNDALVMNQDFAFAWVLGTVKLESMRVKRFPGWSPIPYNLGIWTTCIVVTIATILLSPDLVTEQLGVSLSTLEADLCVAEIKDAGVAELRQSLLTMTNLETARQQFDLMSNFHQALINDTALYGVPPFECPNAGGVVSGKKEDWTKQGSFFPGYCEKALEAAIDAAQSRECISEVCDCPTLPDSIVFEATGLAGERFCGEVCISFPYPCPKHTAEDEQELDDYRFHQFQFAEQRRRNYTMGFPVSVPENVVSTATKTAEKILFQVDVASYLYIGYECLALFFPSPLILFRMPTWAGIKRFLFGVQKPYFICIVVAAWWGVEYFRGIWYSPDIRLFVNNLRAGDPCFVDADYLLDRQWVLNEICEELVPMVPQFRSSAITIIDTLKEVVHFEDDCGCPFPNQHMSGIREAFLQNATRIGFDVPIDVCEDGYSGSDCMLYTPNENITFLGNTSICTNATAARRLVFESAPETETDWWDLWVASGFLALLVVKFAVANYGLSLMALADPFIVCAGEFLWVPTDLGMEIKTEEGTTEKIKFLEAFDERGRALPTEMLEKWFNSKKRALVHIGLSRSVFWGSVVHLCMFNLFVAVQEELGEEPSVAELLLHRDTVVLGVCLGFAALVVFGGYRSIQRLNQLPLPEGHGDTSDDSDDNASLHRHDQRQNPSKAVNFAGHVETRR